MGRRASKKNKKIIGMDTDSIWYKRSKWRRKQGRKLLKSGTYKASDKFMRKFRANSQVGEIFTPMVVDYARRTEVVWRHENEFDPMNHAPGEPHCPNFIPFNVTVIENVEEIQRIWDCIKSSMTGKCAVCNMTLTYNYPKDYPDEWKLCCFCQPNAKMLIEGTLKPTNDKLKKLYDKITLVKENAV